MDDCRVRKAREGELSSLILIDDEASTLYSDVGISMEFADDHPFVLAESRRWSYAIKKGLAYVATNEHDVPIGFITLGKVDDAPYIDQISVHPAHMRQGIGAKLINVAIAWSSEQPLWLTTYSHIPWNQPYYAKHGFVQVPEHLLGPELKAILRHQRAVLPCPEKRIAMLRR